MALSIYKRGQGKYTRLCTAFGAAIIAALGCWQLYHEVLEPAEFGFGRRASLWIEIMVPVGLFGALGFVIYWLVNKPSMADFMISAEGEMKKVSWSSRKEIAVSTFIVIVVVFLMAALLGVVDIIFKMFFTWLLF